MKQEIETPVPATTKTVSKYTCSKCGKPCGPDEPGNFYDLKEASIRVDVTRVVKLKLAPDLEPSIWIGVQSDVQIESEDGKAYPEGGNKEKTIIDCCLACFEEHAVPALVAAGFSVRTEKVDW